MAGVKGMHARASTSPAFAESIRARIKAGGIIERLNNHVLGEIEMSQTQVSAGLGLLKKVVPDLSQVQGPGEGGAHQFNGRFEMVIIDPKG